MSLLYLFSNTFFKKFKNTLTPFKLRLMYLFCLILKYLTTKPTENVLRHLTLLIVPLGLKVFWLIQINIFWFFFKKKSGLFLRNTQILSKYFIKIFFSKKKLFFCFKKRIFVNILLCKNTFFLKFFFFYFLYWTYIKSSVYQNRVNNRIWTYNLQCHKLTLYQLSYTYL